MFLQQKKKNISLLTWDFRLLREEVSVVALISRDHAPRVEEKGINRTWTYSISDYRKAEKSRGRGAGGGGGAGGLGGGGGEDDRPFPLHLVNPLRH